jgi:hypothetical protein
MGKILGALKGKPASAQTVGNTPNASPAPAANDKKEETANAADNAVRLLRGIGTLGLYAAVILIPVVVLGALWFIGQTLYTSIVHLGTQTLVVNPSLARFTAFSMLTTLALLVVAGVALSRIGKRRTLLIAGLFALLWLAITVILALVDTWLTAVEIDPDPTLLRIGVFIYSALPALPAIPIVALAYSAAHEQDGQYLTIGAAAGALSFSLLKAFGAVAMFSIEAFFGISIGVNPIAAIFAALLNATAFIMALGNIQQAVHEDDRGGVTMWGVVSTFYAVVIFAIAAEAIITFSGGKDGALAAMNPPAILEWFAQWAFVSSIGLSAVLIALSFWRKARKELSPASASTGTKRSGDGGGYTIAHRAGQIAARPMILADEFRRGRDEAKAARPALPAGTAATMASDSPLTPDQQAAILAAVMEENERLAKQREPVKGTDSDTTGEVVNADAQGWPTRDDLPKS